MPLPACCHSAHTPTVFELFLGLKQWLTLAIRYLESHPFPREKKSPLPFPPLLFPFPLFSSFMYGKLIYLCFGPKKLNSFRLRQANII